MYLFHFVLLLLMYGTSRGFCNESAFVFVSPLVVSVDTWKKTYTKLVFESRNMPSVTFAFCSRLFKSSGNLLIGCCWLRG